MPLDREDWAALLRHLDEALQRPAVEREAWLQALALGTPTLKAALRELLADRAAIEGGGFLLAGASAELADLGHTPFQDSPDAGAAAHDAGALPAGSVLGPWRLIHLLGRGGMAGVWLAEKADASHRRQVALKLPHREFGSRRLLERFERERAILSTLQHPHIAQVLDAGSVGDQPWLALEYVQGLPITEHARRLALPIRDRLRLFLQVLQAVQFAHARLVIHRDLKPANVLVDAEGRVKLLDFGVAKLLQPDDALPLSAPSALTRRDGRAMTPQYASPEQIAGRPLGVASDVYSLGVLLYELLTGRLPYALKRDSAAALEEAILAAQTLKPSACVGDPAQARALRGDIDTLVMKALAPQPVARYDSAAALADDVERHLTQRPINARAAGLAYRGGRLLRRHALACGAAAAVAAALLGGAALAAWQADRARTEARQAQAVQAFLTQVLAYNDPQQAQGRERSARELLTLAADQIDTRFAGQGDVQARLHHAVGAIFIEMGAMAAAARHLQRAVALRDQAAPKADAEGIESLFRLAQAQIELRDFDAAEATLARTLAAGDALDGSPHRWSGRVLAYQAWVASQRGQLDRSAVLAEQALAVQRKRTGERSADFLSAASHIASIHLARGELARAEALLELFERHGPALPDYPITDQLGQRALLANLRFSRGDMVGAEQVLRAVVPLLDRHLGPAHDRTVLSRTLYARSLAELGRYAEALDQQQANIVQIADRAADEPEALQLAQVQRVRLLTQAGRSAEAVPLARAAVAFLDARYPQPTRYTEAARWYLADALLAQGRRAEGIDTLRQSLVSAQRMGRGDNPLERAAKQLGLALALRLDDAAQAAALAGEGCRALTRALGADNPRTLKCDALLAWLKAVAASDATRDAARDAFAQARAAAERGLPAAHPLRAELLAAEAELLALAPPLPAQAQALRAQADARYRALLGQPLPQPLLSLH